MAGDIDVRERLVLVPSSSEAGEVAAAVENVTGHVLHQYGPDVLVVQVAAADEADMAQALPGAAAPVAADDVAERELERLSETERLGLSALAQRSTEDYRQSKASRRLQGEAWDTDQAQTPGCVEVIAGDEPAPAAGQEAGEAGAAGAPLSQRLQGSVAVGLVIVEGPTPDLQFSPAQRATIVAETQNGLSWLGAQNPSGAVTWHWDINVVALTVPATAPASDNESRFRDPALAELGFGAGHAGARAYAEDLRTRLGTDWAYVAFFTQYPVNHFAYAFIGGPHLVMDYDNDGWGPANIDRVFAHETGHIFNAPDEYASSGCNCGGAWGFYGRPNGNCENCAPGGGVACIMRSNDWAMCEFTPWHFGFAINPPNLVVNNFGYDAGGWRVDQHPRLMADTNADGRADIVGFGFAGAYVSRAQADGSYGALQLVVNDFGYDAGGWRVDRHPRLMARTNPDRSADIVGFGNAGVYVSRANADGSYTPPQLVVGNFGYDAGGWRVDRHPRVLARINPDRRADIVGFGNAGVYVSRAQADGSYGALQLVVGNFGYDAGGWRVDRHPRVLARTNLDRRADIVGFGNAGVYVSRAQTDGSYGALQLVVANFGYDAGGWRVDQHPRFMADTTGDGLADIVGFGNAGVYVSRANPDGSYGPVELAVTNFGYDAGWRVNQHPRFLADTNADGRADVVGCGFAGVWLSRL
ncbi:hypothetical protein BH24ACT14_BH24ACT14_03400 [soil metagenome]